MPEKKKVLETIDEAIRALNWIDQQNLHQYINVPDDYHSSLKRLTYRLSDARMWVEYSRANIKA